MYPLFRSHLDLAHTYWKKLVQPGDILIDATCGNGHDTLTLARLHPRLLYAIDIQPTALESAHKRLDQELSSSLLSSIKFIEGSHAQFPPQITPASVKLLVYNLGYLPGGDKATTTQSSTTLESVAKALELVVPGGAISITCYPGHEEGAREEAALLSFAEQLDKQVWSCCHHRWINRKQAPSLLLLQKDG
ncbi:MAG: class I SAM-dependent methyltransferase [Parachlamydia sp.]|nr:class I SAM-dependent methyltransferase [Parachlamydia sp.]